jgi:hypothetical protein
LSSGFAGEPCVDVSCDRIERTRLDMQAEFRATPQHVLSAARPFDVAQVGQFGLVKTGREGAAEIG